MGCALSVESWFGLRGACGGVGCWVWALWGLVWFGCMDAGYCGELDGYWVSRCG